MKKIDIGPLSDHKKVTFIENTKFDPFAKKDTFLSQKGHPPLSQKGTPPPFGFGDGGPSGAILDPIFDQNGEKIRVISRFSSILAKIARL
jgi:hypothetical protein